jgi:uncharacterized protein (DUF924 family)
MFEEVLRFWFVEISPSQWWKVDPAFDASIAQRFASLHAAAAAGELHDWRVQPEGRLAEILVLDQFSRNIYRGSATAFSSDPMALALAQEAIASFHDAALPVDQRAFLYMPYMHSESRVIQTEAVRLFATLGRSDNYEFALRHKAIIDRFGRYPHRNSILGRISTPQEIEFLKEPGSRF